MPRPGEPELIALLTVCLHVLTYGGPYRAAMTQPSSAPVSTQVEAATALADALQSGFAAQCGGHQRRREAEVQPVGAQ
jgi:hypothetical protein